MVDFRVHLLTCECTASLAFSKLSFIVLSEEAVEYAELDTFLRLKETWDADEDDDKPPPPVIGVPGAAMPLQMTPEHLKKHILAQPPSSPLKGKEVPANKRVGEFDVGDELSGYGLQGVRVTDDELSELVKELGLDDDDAQDLVKGLGDFAPTNKPLFSDVKRAETEDLDEQGTDTESKGPTKADKPTPPNQASSDKPDERLPDSEKVEEVIQSS